MKCLHICNDLLGSKVHENLYSSLEAKSLEQSIFYPLRKSTRDKLSQFKTLNNSLIISKVLKPYHKFFFKKKISYLYKDLSSKCNLLSFDIVHATTLFSDGAIALKIFKEFNTPYIVAIRSTDIDFFLKYRKDLNPLVLEIIKHSSKLVFVSKSLETNFFSHPLIIRYNKKLKLKNKSTIIFNGIDSIWINNIVAQKQVKPTNILYIGKFDSNKNVITLIKAFLILKKKYPNLQLNLVGAGGKQEKEVREYTNQNKNCINFLGPIYDKQELQKIYRSNHIFAMVSKVETFGLVYLEALTQGLPILYTKNQGIDGTFNQHIGKPVDPTSTKIIACELAYIVDNYHSFELEKLNLNEFSWDIIAESYINIYEDIVQV